MTTPQQPGEQTQQQSGPNKTEEELRDSEPPPAPPLDAEWAREFVRHFHPPLNDAEMEWALAFAKEVQNRKLGKQQRQRKIPSPAQIPASPQPSASSATPTKFAGWDQPYPPPTDTSSSSSSGSSSSSSSASSSSSSSASSSSTSTTTWQKSKAPAEQPAPDWLFDEARRFMVDGALWHNYSTWRDNVYTGKKKSKTFNEMLQDPDLLGEYIQYAKKSLMANEVAFIIKIDYYKSHATWQEADRMVAAFLNPEKDGYANVGDSNIVDYIVEACQKHQVPFKDQ